MKKDMFLFKIKNFIELNVDEDIKQRRKDSEYLFDYESWRTVVFSSSKMKFIVHYIQGVFKWMNDVVDMSEFNISISSIVTDKYNFSLFKGDLHLFNCSLQTNFFLIPESQWSEKIMEWHNSVYAIQGNMIVQKSELNSWKGAEGFEQFINIMLMLIREPEKFSNLPIQWNIEFKDKKLQVSRIRMQIDALQNRAKPEYDLIIGDNQDAFTSMEDQDSRSVIDEYDINHENDDNGVDSQKRPVTLNADANADEREVDSNIVLEPLRERKNGKESISSYNKYYHED